MQDGVIQKDGTCKVVKPNCPALFYFSTSGPTAGNCEKCPEFSYTDPVSVRKCIHDKCGPRESLTTKGGC